MVNISTLIAGIKAYIASNPYLNSQLGSKVVYGVVPQQNNNIQTVFPYCAIFTIGNGIANGSFGGNFLDQITLQFSVWATTFAISSTIITEIGSYFSNAQLILTDNTLVGMRRSSTVRTVSNGQNTNNQWIYQSSVDFELQIAGC